MEITIPLVGNPNVRGNAIAAQQVTDQIFTNCVPIVETNSVTQSANVFLQKRPGTVKGSPGAVQSRAVFYSIFQEKTYITGSNNVYLQGVSIGSATSLYLIPFINSTLINGKEYTCFVAYNRLGTTSEGWYHVSDATVTTFTGDRTAGSAVVNNIASTAGLYSGQLISGTGFAVGTRILTVDSSTQVTMNANASSGAPTSTVFTVERLAKILDSDFPTTARGGFAFLDGYAFVQDTSGKIWNSDLNSVTAWSAANYISADTSPDQGNGVYELSGMIVAFGRSSIEFFRNTGNAFGSPLSRIQSMAKNVGILSKNQNAIALARRVGDSLYFVGFSSEGIYLYQLSGGGLTKISHPSVNKYLGAYSQSLVGAVYMMGQVGIVFATHDFEEEITIIPRALTNNYVYWPLSGIWTRLTNPTDGGSDTGYWYTSVYNTALSENVMAGSASSFITLSEGSSSVVTTAWDDDGVAYSTIVQTLRNDLGTERRKFVSKASLLGCDVNSGTATLEFSDDDYANWTTAGTFDLTRINPKVNRLGSFLGGRAWRITHSVADDFRCQSIKFDFDIGTH